MSIRTERVASLIKEEIAAILLREYRDQAVGLTTVTDVRVSGDLKNAKVYFSILGAQAMREQTMQMLESERPRIRSLVGSRLRLKFTPALQFFLDETLDRVDRINTLIRKIHGDGHDPAQGSGEGSGG